MSYTGLTPRQLEIARVVATNSYQDAADILGMTPRNVRYHTQKIIEKLGAQNKLDIANRLLEEGLL